MKKLKSLFNSQRTAIFILLILNLLQLRYIGHMREKLKQVEIHLSNIENILVCGVATNVCCESTARDAMMLNYRALMVSDGCATASDEEHGNSLVAFYTHFGDVQNTDELCARLEASNRRNSGSS